jgi:hypothetical protein
VRCDGEEEEKKLRAAEVLGVWFGAGVESRERILQLVEGTAWGCVTRRLENQVHFNLHPLIQSIKVCRFTNRCFVGCLMK